jgi:hypothetical protein
MSYAARFREIAAALELEPRAVATIPGTRTRTADNARGHSRRRGAGIRRQRQSVRAVLEAYGWHHLRGRVRLCRVTRVSPRPVDEHNLGSALKAVIDGIADAISPARRTSGKWRRECGEDGPSSGIRWVPAQERGPVAVRIEVWID